jgi:hypothetical protein
MSEEMEPRVQTEEVEEEEFERGGLATIAGAPISWTALFAAICAVTTLIPFYFYVTGGGYVSVASGLFMPLAGQVLGPWAGTIAAFVTRDTAAIVPRAQGRRSARAGDPPWWREHRLYHTAAAARLTIRK